MSEKTPKVGKKLETAPSSAKGSASPFAALAPRRNSARIAAGAMLMALSALAGVFIFQSVGSRKEVYVAVRDVPAGQQIVAADVALKRISLDPGVKYMSPADSSALIGRLPASDLLQGSIINPKQIQDAGTPVAPDGQRLVGLNIDLGDRPSLSQLKVGDRLTVAARVADNLPPFTADVTIAKVTLKSGATAAGSKSTTASAVTQAVVDVFVAKDNAADVALYAKDKKIAIVKWVGTK